MVGVKTATWSRIHFFVAVEEWPGSLVKVGKDQLYLLLQVCMSFGAHLKSANAVEKADMILIVLHSHLKFIYVPCYKRNSIGLLCF